MNQEEHKKECRAARWHPVPQRKEGAIQCDHCMIGYTTDYLMFASAVFTAALSHGTYKPKVFA
jgi:hypothetical protein